MASNGKPAPKMVKLTINGQEIEVREGTNLVDAAEQLGIEVPHYCYHPGLSIPANCRICQCEVEGAPKLVFGCRTPAKDGMVVHTDSPKAKAAQQLVQEFLLCNHPLDCEIKGRIQQPFGEGEAVGTGEMVGGGQQPGQHFSGAGEDGHFLARHGGEVGS